MSERFRLIVMLAVLAVVTALAITGDIGAELISGTIGALVGYVAKAATPETAAP